MEKIGSEIFIPRLARFHCIWIEKMLGIKLLVWKWLKKKIKYYCNVFTRNVTFEAETRPLATLLVTQITFHWRSPTSKLGKHHWFNACCIEPISLYAALVHSSR